MAQKFYSQILMKVPPTENEHLVTKAYVDLAVNRKVKDAVRVVATSNVDLTAAIATPIDGVTLVAHDRVLLAGQTDETENGIYELGTAGMLARSEDFNANEKIPFNVIIPVREGSQADVNWQLINDEPVILGTSSLKFVRFKADADVHSAHAEFEGNDADKEFVISHGLGLTNLIVRIVDATTKEEAHFNVVATTENTITVKSDVVLTPDDKFEVTILA